MILHKAFFGISSALFILMTDNPFMVIACALCASIWLFSISYEVDANIKQEVFWRKYFAGELD